MVLRMGFRHVAALVSAASLATGAFGVALDILPAHAAPAGFGVYVPMSPVRILDTRLKLGLDHKPGVSEVFQLNLSSSAAAVPGNAVAVVLNVTATQADAGGFVSAWPSGLAQPNTSIINIERAGQTLANLVTLPLGAGGSISLFTEQSMHMIADVQGYYSASAFDGVTAVDRAGRFVPAAMRMYDTRLAQFGNVPLGAGSSVSLDIRPFNGGSEAVAAVLKVTVAQATAGGYWTVYPAGGALPNASNINANDPGDTVPNQVITQVTDGQFTIYSEAGGHVIVDLLGYFTSPTAALGTTGEFHPISPDRWLDMRTGTALAPRLVHANRTVEVGLRSSADLPADKLGTVGSVVMNLTVTQSTTGGYFTAIPGGTNLPDQSSSNVNRRGQTFANHTITQVSARGFDIYTEHGGYMIADITGYFTGTPTTAVLPPPVPVDSWLAALVNPVYSLTPGTQTIRWDPCRAIRYRVNLTDYSYDGGVVDEAMKRLSTATGLEFVNVGNTTYMPAIDINNPNQVWSQSTPFQGYTRTGDYEIVIVLDPSNKSGVFTGPGELGVTQTMYTRAGTGEITLATVMINMSTVGAVAQWNFEGLGPVLLHELGHGVGLNHVPLNTNNLMEATSNPSEKRQSYGAGDLYGLRVVGESNGCVNPTVHGTQNSSAFQRPVDFVSAISR